MSHASFAGIDLGSTRTKVAVPDPQGNPVMLVMQGDLFINSAVFMDDAGPIVGDEALNAGLADPTRLVVNWKRSIGTDKVLYASPDGVEYRARDFARIVLEAVRYGFEKQTGRILNRVAISVPANYTDVHKIETEEAGKATGLQVVEMPHEPTAALVGMDCWKHGDGLRLVIDIGGGTTDISIAEVTGNNIDVKSTNGIPALGGEDFNAWLAEIILSQFEAKHGYRPTPEEHPIVFQELRTRVENLKISLSTRNEGKSFLSCNGHILNVTVTQEQFRAGTEELVEKIMDKTEETLVEAEVSVDDLEEILLVGGPSQMPMIGEAIERRLGRKPTVRGEPHYAVPRGNVILGRLAIERAGDSFEVGGRRLPPLDYGIRDVTAHDIGVCVLTDDDRQVNNVILSKGARIPSDQMRQFHLAERGQTDARIEILQGKDGLPREECALLGHIELTGMQPVHEEIHRIEVRLKIDRNGILNASAYDPISGKSEEMSIDYKGTNGNG